MQGYTDIRAEGWVAHLPAGWRPYALLARFDWANVAESDRIAAWRDGGLVIYAPRLPP